jgi:serine protease
VTREVWNIMKKPRCYDPCKASLASAYLLLALTPGLGAQPPALSPEHYVPGEVLTQCTHEATASLVAAPTGSRRAERVLETSVLSRVSRIAVTEGSEVEAALSFAAAPGCEWASPNFVARGQSHGLPAIPPDDPNYGYQTNLALIDIEAAWLRTAGSTDVVVAVLDSGIAYEDRAIPAYELGGVAAGVTQYRRAPDMAQTHFVPGWDFVYGDGYANDDYTHGTGVAHVIAEDTDNGLDSAGIAGGVTLMPVKVSASPSGATTFARLIDGIVFATQAEADVINMSIAFGSVLSNPSFDGFFAGLNAALESAHDAGILLVAATGNDGGGVVSRPALHADVIAVGASNFDGFTRAFYSQTSTGEAGRGIAPTPGLPGSVELVAPTGDYSDRDGNGIADGLVHPSIVPFNPQAFSTYLLAGTSYAVPQVTAVGALMISAGLRTSHDGRGVDVLRQILRDTALDLGPAGSDLEYGAGQLDAGAAVNAESVTICHHAQGKSGRLRTVEIDLPAIDRHLDHGDSLGACN